MAAKEAHAAQSETPVEIPNGRVGVCPKGIQVNKKE